MTLTEKEWLTRFLEQLVSANAGQKDVAAEALIKEAVARQPDAAYLLAQRALQLEHLLQTSQEQLSALQKELEQARSGSSHAFLGDPNAWGSRSSATPAQQPLGGTSFGSRPSPAPQGGSWATGIFGNVAATAAGVVAGSFLFQGLQELMNRGESASPGQQVHSASLPDSLGAPEGHIEDMFADFDDSGDFA
jgi:hypothetical protein